MTAKDEIYQNDLLDSYDDFGNEEEQEGKHSEKTQTKCYTTDII